MNTGSRTGRLTCAAVTVLLMLLGNVARAQKDKITLADGKEELVTILSEDFDSLRYSLQGGTAGHRWKEVVAVRYAGAEKYYQALDPFNAGRFGEAVPLFEALYADTKLRPLVKHSVFYHLALAYQRIGKPDKAIATYQELVTAFPKSRHLLAVSGNLLSIHLERGDMANAQKAIDTAMATAKDADASLQAGFDLLRGRLLEEQKKFAEAENVFAKSASTAGADADVVGAAKLGGARCAQRSGQTAEAQRRYSELTDLDVSNNVHAGAWNGLGDIALDQATQKRDAEGLRVALFAYLHTVVMYVPEADGPTDEFERGLAGASKAFKAIGEVEKKPDVKKLFNDRAKACRDQLAAEHADSPYLKGL